MNPGHGVGVTRFLGNAVSVVPKVCQQEVVERFWLGQVDGAVDRRLRDIGM